MEKACNIEDFDYVREVLRINPGTQCWHFEKCLQAMRQYNESWWRLLHDEGELAAKQIDEPVLLIPIETFKAGVEAVIGRKITKYELSLQNLALIAEFKKKYSQYEPSKS